jgi:hypothetical protein
MIERRPYSFFCILAKVFLLAILFLLVLPTTSVVHAQDPDEEGEIFWGSDEEEEDDEYADDEEEYLDEDEYEDEYEEEDEEEYYEEEDEADEEAEDEEEDEEEYDDEDAFEDEDTGLADEAEDLGWSIDVSGSSPRFVNEALMTWNSTINVRASIEAPLLMEVMGMKLRFGAEFGNYGFEDSMPPQTAEEVLLYLPAHLWLSSRS